MSSTITKDPAVKLLRAARQDMEDHMAKIAEAMLQYRATISAQAEDIARLEDELEIRTNQANEFQRRMNEYRDATRSHEAAERLFRKAHVNIDPHSRAANVTRLANAARHHIEHGRYAIADMLLAPLSQGVHDAYRHHETAEDRVRARPHAGGEDNEIPYTFPLFTRHDCIPPLEEVDMGSLEDAPDIRGFLTPEEGDV